jgi:hypothetical protein
MPDSIPESSQFERMPHCFACWGRAGDWWMVDITEGAPDDFYERYVVEYHPGYNNFYKVDLISQPYYPQYNSEFYSPTYPLPDVPSDLGDYGQEGGIFGVTTGPWIVKTYSDDPDSIKTYDARLASGKIYTDADGNYTGVDFSLCENLNKVNLCRGPQQATSKFIIQNPQGETPSGIEGNIWYEYEDGFISTSSEESGHGLIYYYFVNEAYTGFNVYNLTDDTSIYPLGWSAPLGSASFVDCHTAEFPKSHLTYAINGCDFNPTFTYSKTVNHGHDLVNLVHTEYICPTDNFPGYAPGLYYPDGGGYGGFANRFCYDRITNFGFDITLADQFKV